MNPFAIKRLADVSTDDSLSNRMRSRRFTLFETLAAKLPRPLRIIDVGGTNLFWERRHWAGRDDVHITLVNLTAETQRHKNIVSAVGDATNLHEYGDKAFDIAFSNSVIEHLFTFDNQRKMAAELQRVAKAYWVQTPNFWFPIEPHFHVPGWQWMPQSMRVAILRRRTCGWRGRIPDPVKARETVAEVRLMTRKELKECFPSGRMIPERFCLLVKSWMVVGGFPQ
jgi:Methyltransferase domain